MLKNYCNLFDFRALGFLGFCLSSTGDNACLAALDMFVQCLHGALMSTSGAAHIVAGMTVTEWTSFDKVHQNLHLIMSLLLLP